MTRLATVLVLALGAIACDGDRTPQGDTQTFVATDGASALLESGDVLLRVAHAGVRRLEFRPASAESFSFRERIATDGEGRFSIEPVEPVGATAFDWGSFELLQRSSEGFLFRYRDFAVRDSALFARNYRWHAMGQSQVAGRGCALWRIERVIGEPMVFELSVDSATGIVLACRELDGDGRETASMVYESVDLAPDLRNVVWHRAANEEEVLDRGTSASVQIGASVLEPRLLPTGYARGEAALVTDGDGRRWLKQTYLDGVESLFFLQALAPSADAGEMEAASVPSATPVPGEVVVFRIGSALAIQGVVAGHELAVIGRAPEAELLDLIESALP